MWMRRCWPPSPRRGCSRRRRWRTGGVLCQGRLFRDLDPDEVVSFFVFHERGLGYPTHWFLRGLLNEWGLELQHLSPTRVLHIIDFITVYEASSG